MTEVNANATNIASLVNAAVTAALAAQPPATGGMKGKGKDGKDKGKNKGGKSTKGKDKADGKGKTSPAAALGPYGSTYKHTSYPDLRAVPIRVIKQFVAKQESKDELDKEKEEEVYKEKKSKKEKKEKKQEKHKKKRKSSSSSSSSDKEKPKDRKQRKDSRSPSPSPSEAEKPEDTAGAGAVGANSPFANQITLEGVAFSQYQRQEIIRFSMQMADMATDSQFSRMQCGWFITSIMNIVHTHPAQAQTATGAAPAAAPMVAAPVTAAPGT